MNAPNTRANPKISDRVCDLPLANCYEACNNPRGLSQRWPLLVSSITNVSGFEQIACLSEFTIQFIRESIGVLGKAIPGSI